MCQPWPIRVQPAGGRIEQTALAPTPNGFHHVTLTVTDLGRSAAWYQVALNLGKVADRAGDTWTRVLRRALNGLKIGLTEHQTSPADAHFDPTAAAGSLLVVKDPDGIPVEFFACA